MQAYYHKVSSNSETESSRLLSTFCRCRAAVWHIHAVSTSTYEQTSRLGKGDWLQYICEAGTSKECCGGRHSGPGEWWGAGRSFFWGGLILWSLKKRDLPDTNGWSCSNRRLSVCCLVIVYIV